MAVSLLIFSDLDGTLLDSETYSFDRVVPVLKSLKEQGVPLVMCSSKTRFEMEVWRERLGLNDPFIVENGSAIVFPAAWGIVPNEPLRVVGDMRVLELGLPHEDILSGLEDVSRETGIRVKGLSTMSLHEIMERTGLSGEEAERAKEREYSEPFVVQGKATSEDMHRFLHLIQEKGMTYTRGGRFHHVMGATDKGKAVRVLTETMRSHRHGLRTVALGDSPNDISMLRAADIPILVQRPDGTYADLPPEIKCYRAPGVGPNGWAAAVQMLLEGKDLRRMLAGNSVRCRQESV